MNPHEVDETRTLELEPIVSPLECSQIKAVAHES